MNRLQVWGITAADGLVFKTLLEELAWEELETYTKPFFKHTFPVWQGLRLQEKLEVAFGQALKEFLKLVQDGLEDADCWEAEQYIDAFRQFVQDTTVLAELGKPFAEAGCDADRLAGRWHELNLSLLPDEFSWGNISRRYGNKVKAIIQESDDFRAIFNPQKLAVIQRYIKEQAGIIPGFDLSSYREKLANTYGNLKLDKVDRDTGYSYQIKLLKLFVAQNVREVQETLPQIYELPKEHLERLKQTNQLEDDADIPPEVLEGYKQAYSQQPLRSVLEIIDDERSYPYIVILGDPGSGKSSLLQYIALRWAEAPIEELPSQPIPFLIELRSYTQRQDNQNGQNFLGGVCQPGDPPQPPLTRGENSVKVPLFKGDLGGSEFDRVVCRQVLEFFQQGSGFICSLDSQQLHELFQSGKAVVLFDGLDEVFEPSQREQVITDIIHFSTIYPQVRVIVTSRVIGYKPQRLRDARFRHFMLQDLELEQIHHFIDTWHDLAFTKIVDKERMRDRLRVAINSYTPIRELAGNPLLLTMMAILNRNQELPRDRVELYKKASEVLLQQWDLARELVDDTKTIDLKDKQAMLRRVACQMQTNKKGIAGNLISAGELENTITQYLSKIKVTHAQVSAESIIKKLRERNFILCFLGADYYAFVHRTFLEYFCAWQFVWQYEKERSLTLDALKAEVFGKYWQDESWHEVLRLIAGMLDARFTGEIIEYLIAQKGEAEKFSSLFLAAKCLSEVRNPAGIAATATQLLNRLKALTKYDLHYYYKPYGEEASLVREIRTKAVAAVATTWKDDPDTLPMLKQLATTDWNSDVRRAAVQELAGGWKNDPDTLPFLKQRATTDRDSSVRSAAVQELAGGWKNDPDTLPFLKQRATTDKDWSVRSAAVQELAGGWKNDPDTLPILKQRATTDQVSSVRRAAVQELARGWKNDPDTLPILKQRATTDQDSDVRSAAVQELARGWKHDPDTLPILKQRATTDKDWSVRRAAVQELARGWKNDPDTLPILKQLATTDQDSSVRRAAVQELARGWKHDPDALPILKHRGTTNHNSDVRRAAVQELARGWKDDPDTLPILKQRATTDEDSSVRSAAVQELARGWKDEPWMFELLCDRAVNDPFKRQYDFDNNPRQTALKAIIQHYPDHPQTLALLRKRAIRDQDEKVRELAKEELRKRRVKINWLASLLRFFPLTRNL
jgi:predicted NACHT family NTPase